MGKPSSTASNDDPSIATVLTTRERECLFRLLHGETVKEIAQMLTRSNKTVETHIYRIKEKLHCNTRSQLFKKALNQGLIKIMALCFWRNATLKSK